MCGIAGLISSRQKSESLLKENIILMTEKIKHRGPDGSGIWIEPKLNLALGHRRLSVIDLSNAGEQPMTSPSGRYIISFNGEIYNHIDLRKKINFKNKNFFWHGNSDTESLLAMFDLFGIDKTLIELKGMFAFAVWDKKTNFLTLARDRFGEKPLFYGWSKENFFFASELKSFTNLRDSSNSVSRKALDYFLRFMYVPAPLSIFKNIYKLEPGSMLQINCSKFPEVLSEDKIIFTKSSIDFIFSKWWDIDSCLSCKDNIQEKYSSKDHLENVEKLLSSSIQRQLIGDVPLGAFLSGGIDSSLVAALMAKHSKKKINTYTIGFESKKYDESIHANNVAKSIGTNHHEEIITASTATDVIPKLPIIFDEPFADSSQIPTYLVSHFAKKEITVALTGDGADELFGGYNRYTQAAKSWDRLYKLPKFSRTFLGNILSHIPHSALDFGGNMLNKLGYGSRNYFRFADKIRKASFYLTEMSDLNDVLANPVSEWPIGTTLVKGAPDQIENFNLRNTEIFEKINSTEIKMMVLDCKTYLPDDILCKVDRSSMSNSLETRAPFLDDNLAEYAFNMPLELKIKENTGKVALRNILYKYVPKKIIERPKMGFAVPVSDWLRGPLKDWARNLLDEKKIEEQGYLFPEIVSHIWHQHQSGKFDHSAKLWAILTFQSWLEEYER